MNQNTYLVGKRYGRLLVMSNSGDNHKGYFLWLCKCDCGNTKLVSTNKLTQGQTKSCGCLQKENFKDLTGKKFGFLTAIKRVGSTAPVNNMGIKAIWECQCDCGNIVSIVSSRLIIGKTKSCGCARKVNINGQLFGSYLEAAIWLDLSSKWSEVVINQKYPGINLRFDFFVPLDSTYVEVTSYNGDCRWFPAYLEKIEKKRRYVEDVLHSKFLFICRQPTKEEYKSVWAVMDHRGRTEPQQTKEPKVKKDEFWSSVDWSKSDHIIAGEIGYTPDAVEKHRKEITGINWNETKLKKLLEKIDWSKTNKEIAKDTGRSLMGIVYIRKKLGVKTMYKERTDEVRRQKWEGTDWSLSNGAIAKLKNVSADTVGNARLKLGIKNPHNISQEEFDKNRRDRWAGTDWSMSNSDIARQKGLTDSTVGRAREKLGFNH